MLRKFSIALSLISALVLGFAIVAPSASFAKNQNQNQNKNVHVNKKVFVKKNVVVVNKKFVVGKKYDGHVWYGRNRHRWHDRWYAYGDGPCWINVDGLWFWNDAACP